MITSPFDLPEELEHKIEDEATRQGRQLMEFMTLLIGISAIPEMRESEDRVTRDLSEELMFYFQSAAADMERRSGKTLDTLPHLFPETLANDPTLALFAQWDAEDATDDPEEIARRQRDGDELLRSLAENPISFHRTDVGGDISA